MGLCCCCCLERALAARCAALGEMVGEKLEALKRERKADESKQAQQERGVNTQMHPRAAHFSRASGEVNVRHV